MSGGGSNMSTYIIQSNTPQSTRLRTLLDDHPITEDVIAFDIRDRLRKDEQNYLHSIDTKYPKTLRTRLDTLGRTVAIPAGALGSLYAYAKLSNKLPALRKTFDHIDQVAAPAVMLGGFIGGLKAVDAFKNPRSKMLGNIEDDITEQQEALTKKILRDPKLLNAYTAEHLRSVRTPSGRKERMDIFFDTYDLPKSYKRHIKV